MRLIPSGGYIYLASPYSHPDPWVREFRYLKAMECLCKHLKQGYFMYSPIVHCHDLAKVEDMPKHAEFWKAYNFTMLAAAEQLWVLLLDGWENSVGCQAECAEAERLGIVIYHIILKDSEYAKAQRDGS